MVKEDSTTIQCIGDAQMTFDFNAYYREKYKNDPEYRKNRIRWSAVWDKNNRGKINTIHRKWYANRTTQQIKKFLKSKLRKFIKYYEEKENLLLCEGAKKLLREFQRFDVSVTKK